MPKVLTNITRFFKITGLIAGVFLILWFARALDFNAILQQLKEIHFKFFIIIIPPFISYFMATTAWRLCFRRKPENVALWQLFFIRQIGESLAQINPTNFVAGDTLKGVLLRKKGIATDRTVVSLALSRFLMIISGISLVFIFVIIFFDKLSFFSEWVKYVSIFLMVVVTIITILTITLIKGDGLLSLPLFYLKKKYPDVSFISKTFRKIRSFDIELLSFLKEKKLNFTLAYFVTLFHWFGGSGELYLILTFLGIDVSIASCIAFEIGVQVFKNMGGFIPGQIGVEEYANKLMLEFSGVTGNEVWMTVSIIKRTRQLFWIGVGFLCFITFQKVQPENGEVKIAETV